jgi:hypothetical protein
MRAITRFAPADYTSTSLLNILSKSVMLCCFCFAVFGCDRSAANTVVTWHNDYALEPPIKAQAMWASQLTQPWTRLPPFEVLRIKVFPRGDHNHPLSQDKNGSTEGMDAIVDNCEKLFSANEKSLGPIPIELSAYQYMALKCYIGKAISRAKSSKMSYVANWVLDKSTVKQLPPQLAFIISSDDQEAVGRAEARHDPLGAMFPSANISLKAVKDNHHVVVDDGVSVQEMALVAKGDFNGDGVEDLLVSSENHLSGGRYRQYGLYVVTRLKKGGALTLVKTYSVMTSGM